MRILGGKKEMKERIKDLEREVDHLGDKNHEHEAELELLREHPGTNPKAELKAVKAVKAELEKMQRKYSELEGTFAAVKGVVSNHDLKKTLGFDEDGEDEDIKRPRRRCRIL
jgi:predicted  nucleic acid-binding Zn-ribbon protein